MIRANRRSDRPVRCAGEAQLPPHGSTLRPGELHPHQPSNARPERDRRHPLERAGELGVDAEADTAERGEPGGEAAGLRRTVAPAPITLRAPPPPPAPVLSRAGRNRGTPSRRRGRSPAWVGGRLYGRISVGPGGRLLGRVWRQTTRAAHAAEWRSPLGSSEATIPGAQVASTACVLLDPRRLPCHWDITSSRTVNVAGRVASAGLQTPFNGRFRVSTEGEQMPVDSLASRT